jgi:hypothetical protein
MAVTCRSSQKRYSVNISHEHMQLMWLKDGKQNREDWCRHGANELKIWKD